MTDPTTSTGSAAVTAHSQAVTHQYEVHYPAHPARADDPHYRDFEEYRRRTHATARCAIGAHRGDFSECSVDKPLELHHAHVEFSLQNGVDLAWLEKDYPGISDPSTVGAWVESASNLEWLCVTEDSPVLLSDGTRRAMSEIQVGDRVVGHDGLSHVVKMTGSRRYRGYVTLIGEAGLTAEHPVLTQGGWTKVDRLLVGEIVRKLRMPPDKMFTVRGTQHQVVDEIVSAIPVQMMNPLTVSQRSPQVLFHDDAMFHAAVRQTNVAVLDHFRSRQLRDSKMHPRLGRVPSRKVTRPGTRMTSMTEEPRHENRDLDVTRFTRCRHALGRPASLSRPLTLLATGDVSTWQRQEPSSTHDARQRHQLGRYPIAEASWQAVRKLRRIWFNGTVHDISVAGSHSYVVGDVAVHNCEFHHRGHGGVHVASASDYEAERYVRGLIT